MIPGEDQSMSASFHNADKPTHRRVMLVGFMFCAVFVAISFLARPQPQTDYVLVKADKLVRTAGQPVKAN
ncbi:MAG: hypothetical protein CFE29_07695 [Bradyrhizobiaceae bacterium PARB1]|jgi:hypothetical protein|nr:MAG: hypothetical protein CFE29_07695 [Bradyrhizobiaceae bacterium PARB1]